MPSTVVHFEIYSDEPEELAGFYTKVFGWRIDKVPEMDYWTVHTVPSDEKGMPTQPGGVNGGLMKRPTPDARAWLNYVSVESIDATVEQVSALGGRIVRPKSPVPKMGWFCVLADPEMNVFALWQDDPNAG